MKVQKMKKKNNYTPENHTFVICAYKESPYLEDCIHSLEQQTLKSNIIMVTSTPCEYIANIAKKHDITLYINEGEGGIAQDWNFGYSKITTPLLTIAHQDDIYSKHYLEKVLDGFNSVKKPLIAFTDYGELRDGKKIFKSKLIKIKKLILLPMRPRFVANSRFIRRRCLALGSCICCPSVSFARENLPEVVFTAGLKSNLDWEAWENLSRLKGAFVYLKTPLMLHRIHEESETSHLIKDNKRSSEDYAMFRKFWPRGIARLLTKIYSAGEKYN